MVGITSYGIHVPRYRLNRRTVFEAMGWFNAATGAVARGEKAVANYDEDPITMAVAAAVDCTEGFSRDRVDGLYLASVTLPHMERQNAAICAGALALRPDIRTADFVGSLKSGTTALIAACDAVTSGSAKNILVCAADARMGKPGSSLEHLYGDGAAAIQLGSDGVIARLVGSYCLCSDFQDFVRLQADRFPHAWEERWIRDEGYLKLIPRVIEGLLEKHNVDASSIDRFVVACPDRRALMEIGKKLGIPAEKLQDNLIDEIGDTGSALGPMMLIAALETAGPGDRILVAGYGSGGDGLLFEATEEIARTGPRKGIQESVQRKKPLESYTKYLVFRDLLQVETGLRGEERPLVRKSMTNREGANISALRGSRCKACATPQYPGQRVCVNPDCRVVDQMEDYFFSDKIGKINSFTGDQLAFSWDPPAIYGLIDFEDGGRLYLDITDTDLQTLRVGAPVRMSFRRRYSDPQRGMYAYFWKAVPTAE